MDKSGRNAQRVAVAEAKLHQYRRILRVMEAQLPANPNDPKNDKHVDRIEGVVVGYFDVLFDSLDMQKLEMIYWRNVEQE